MTVVQSPDNVGRNITTDYFTVIWGLFRGGGVEGRAGEAKVLGNEKQRTRPDTLRREMPPNHGQAPPALQSDTLRLSFRDDETSPADKRYCAEKHLESEA